LVLDTSINDVGNHGNRVAIQTNGEIFVTDDAQGCR
jgi:hypothetical protein